MARRILLPVLALLFIIPSPIFPAKVIFTLNFENINNAIVERDYSAWIPALILNHLIGSPNIVVVERQRLDALIEEQDLSATDYVDKKTAIRLGRLLGAHKAIMGEYQDAEGHRCHIRQD